MQNRKNKDESLHYEELIWGTLSNKWKISILLNLSKGAIRFNQLQRCLRGISDKVLASTLKELERDGLVKKEIFEGVILHSEYSLTEKGKALLPIIQRLVDWWKKY
ncbi:MAG: helix-turn-helix transcriptional regulator [Oscillospiraceae bacterium]|nr:helix-turn-helix transcriptional regulator [Oscillospiraceae bacterium]